jgi:hypothetical protein
LAISLLLYSLLGLYFGGWKHTQMQWYNPGKGF